MTQKSNYEMANLLRSFDGNDAAQVVALLAVADGLNRIGDLLEAYMGTQGVSPEVVEAANRSLEYQDRIYQLEQQIQALQTEPDEHWQGLVHEDDRERWGEEFRAEKKQAQEFLRGTRKGLGLE